MNNNLQKILEDSNENSSFQTTYGIDKCVIGGLSIKSIDKDLLHSSPLTQKHASTIENIFNPTILKKINRC